MENISVVIIEFYNSMDLWLMKEDYKSLNGFFKFCSYYSVRPNEVKKVNHCVKKASEWPNEEWEG